MSEVNGSFEEYLEKEGTLVYRTKGTSMRPMLHGNRDLVILVPPAARPEKYDVVLYRRGEKYVLHRVFATETDYCLIRGDNTYRTEKVPYDRIIAVLTGFVRNGREYDGKNRLYRLYARFWCAVYPVRKIWHPIKLKAVSALRRLLMPKAGR